MTSASHRGTKVDLDHERRLRFTLGAVDEIQDRFDIDIVAGEQFDLGNLDDLVWVVWLGLKHAGEEPDLDLPWWERVLIHFGLKDPPTLTEEMVREWIDMENLVQVSQALNEAMGNEQVDAAQLEARAGNPTGEGGETETTPSR